MRPIENPDPWKNKAATNAVDTVDSETRIQAMPMTNQNLEQLNARAKTLCAARNVEIRPYGSAWWLVGNGVSLVVSQLEGLSPSHLAQMRVIERPQLAP